MAPPLLLIYYKKMSLKEKIIGELSACFQGHEFALERLEMAHRGRFANAHIYHYRDEKFDLMVKDFSHCIGVIRGTFGRFSISREFNALMALQSIGGIASNVQKISPNAIAYTFIPGKPLSCSKKNKTTLPVSFFEELEKNVAAMHAKKIVHLDLRNLSNILCDDDGKPCLIDFQSAIRLDHIPKFLREFLIEVDMSGICKAWDRCCAVPLPPDKRAFYDKFNRLRKLWILKGYPFSKTIAKLRSRKNLNAA